MTACAFKDGLEMSTLQVNRRCQSGCEEETQHADALRLASTLYDRTLLKNWKREDEDQSGDQGPREGSPLRGRCCGPSRGGRAPPGMRSMLEESCTNNCH